MDGDAERAARGGSPGWMSEFVFAQRLQCGNVGYAREVVEELFNDLVSNLESGFFAGDQLLNLDVERRPMEWCNSGGSAPA